MIGRPSAGRSARLCNLSLVMRAIVLVLAQVPSTAFGSSAESLPFGGACSIANGYFYVDDARLTEGLQYRFPLKKSDHYGFFFVGTIDGESSVVQFKCTPDDRFFSRVQSVRYDSLAEARAVFDDKARQLAELPEHALDVRTLEHEIAGLRSQAREQAASERRTLTEDEKKAMDLLEQAYQHIHSPENVFAYGCRAKIMTRVDLRKEEQGFSVFTEVLDVEVASSPLGGACRQ